MHRSELVRRMKDHLERRRHPRTVLSAIVILAGLVGFGVSFALLSFGMASIAARYGIAGTAAYLSFIGLLRAWASGHRGDDVVDAALDLVQVPDVSFGGGKPSGGAVEGLLGGRSGGAGASSGWTESGTSRLTAVRTRPSRGSAGIDFDADDAVWIFVLIAAVASSVLALGFVIYSAPALLAEVIVDAVIVSAVYRRVAVKDTRHWAATVVRRTWFAAIVVVVSLTAGGYALQRLVPEARSIGPAVSALTERF